MINNIALEITAFTAFMLFLVSYLSSSALSASLRAPSLGQRLAKSLASSIALAPLGNNPAIIEKR